MWDQYFKRWVDLFFWWLPKKDGPSSDEATPGAASERRTAETAAPPPRQEAPAAPPREPSPERPQTAEVPAARPPAPEAAPERSEAPPRAAAPDDLTEIKGIGPAVQEKLRTLGITTFGELAAADPEQLTEELKGSQPISKARVQEWTETARKRAGSRV